MKAPYTFRLLISTGFNSFVQTDEEVKDEKVKARIDDWIASGEKNYEPLEILTSLKVDKNLEIPIKDNGPGIPGNIIDKIFQPFFTTKPTGQGTGLGLSLAYDILKAHGGNISVDSHQDPSKGDINVVSGKNGGTEFIIQLPI